MFGIKQFLTIEIGYSTIQICEMRGDAPRRVLRCIQTATPKNAVADGYLLPQKADELKEAIVTALAEHKIKTRNVIFSLYSSKIITREISLPNVKQNQINAIIETNIDEYFPIELDEYTITHTCMEQEQDGKTRVLAILAETNLIEQYQELAAACGLKLIDIDYVGNSVFHMCKETSANKTQMIIRLAQENALVMLMKDGTLLQQRNMNYGISDAVTTAEDMEEAVEPFIRTLLRMIDFYQGQAEDNQIQQIVLIGKGAKFSEYLQVITQETGIPIEVLSHVSKVKSQKKQLPQNIYEYVSCMGAGISPIHLIKEKNEITQVNYPNTIVLLVIFFVVAIVALSSSAVLPYLEQVSDNRQLQEQKERYAPAKELYDTYCSVSQLYAQVLYGHELTQHTNDQLLAFLEELEKKLPSDLVVTEFSSDDQEAVITMKASQKEYAAAAIQTIREFASLSAVSVNGVTENQVNTQLEATAETETTEVVFSITCIYQPIMVQAPEEQEETLSTTEEIVNEG